jgi:hypothetical protein
MTTIRDFINNRLIDSGWKPEWFAKKAFDGKSIKVTPKLGWGDHGYYVEPSVFLADKAEWRAARRNVADIIPDGTKIVGGDVTIEFTSKRISLVQDGKVIDHHDAGGTMKMFLNDMLESDEEAESIEIGG